MIVCLCRGVSERAIQQVLAEGCMTIVEIAEQCGAGSDCGSCLCDIREMVQGVPEPSQD